MSNNEEVYFAARSAEECAAVLIQKSESFYTALNSNKYLDKLYNMYRYYYGSHYDSDNAAGHTISFAGEQGELTQLPVNHFRNLAKNIINMITANRPILEARAINTDYKSLSQTYLANGILDYYMREKGLEDIVNEAVEMSLILGAAYIKMAWNSMKGEVYETDDNGKPLLNGEMEFSLLSPLDVVVDGTLERYEDREWVITRSYVTRYNLIAKYPQYHNEIMNIKAKNDASATRLGWFSNDKTDSIPIFEFFHKKTEAIEDGRYMLYLSDKAVLMDGPLPYRDIPLFRLSNGNIMGTPYGYSDMFDIYPIQEMMNSIYSGISTNQNAHLVQSLFIERGSDIVPDSVMGGMTIIEGNKPPVAVQLTSTPEEAFKFLEVLKQDAETLVGVNSVTRGNPEASLRSGTALALVQSMSIQYQSGFQRAYVKFLENIGSSLIEILKDYANAPKMIAIVGKNKAPLLKEFTGDMIKDVSRVVVDVGNPLSRTIAGRVEMADHLAQMKLIQTPEKYMMVLETGRLDTMYEGDMSELLNIKRENELFMQGQPSFVDELDRHRLHIAEHRSVINDPELRAQPELYRSVKEHIQEHIMMLRTVDPDLLQMIGETPLMNPGQQQGVVPDGGQLPPDQMPQQGGQQPGGPMGNGDVVGQGNIQQVMDQSLGGAQSPADQVIDGQPSVDGSLLPNPSLESRVKK